MQLPGREGNPGPFGWDAMGGNMSKQSPFAGGVPSLPQAKSIVSPFSAFPTSNATAAASPRGQMPPSSPFNLPLQPGGGSSDVSPFRQQPPPSTAAAHGSPFMTLPPQLAQQGSGEHVAQPVEGGVTNNVSTSVYRSPFGGGGIGAGGRAESSTSNPGTLSPLRKLSCMATSPFVSGPVSPVSQGTPSKDAGAAAWLWALFAFGVVAMHVSRVCVCVEWNSVPGGSVSCSLAPAFSLPPLVPPSSLPACKQQQQRERPHPVQGRHRLAI